MERFGALVFREANGRKVTKWGFGPSPDGAGIVVSLAFEREEAMAYMPVTFLISAAEIEAMIICLGMAWSLMEEIKGRAAPGGAA